MCLAPGTWLTRSDLASTTALKTNLPNCSAWSAVIGSEPFSTKVRMRRPRLVRGEHDEGHRLQGRSDRILMEVPLVGVLLLIRVYGESLFRRRTQEGILP